MRYLVCDYCTRGSSPDAAETHCNQLCENYSEFEPLAENPCSRCCYEPDSAECHHAEGGTSLCKSKVWWASIERKLCE